MTEALRRDRFRVALVGRPAVMHAEMIRRAGYRVVTAIDGLAAGRLFRDDAEPYDALVIDFALEGRPPEAVLLFGRRTSPSAPVVALVPAASDEAFRRAFLAGARDVLPSPARGEDLLDAIDIVLEPRALNMMLDELRNQVPTGTQTAYAPDEDEELLMEIEELRGSLARMEQRERQVTDQFRAQALEAVTARDEMADEFLVLQRTVAGQEKELKSLEASLRLNARATEELQNKLKEARDQRREAEERAALAETRVHELEIIQAALDPHTQDALPSDTDPNDVWGMAGEIDPVLGMAARHEDEEKLTELERALVEKARLDARVENLEETLATPFAPGTNTDLSPPPVTFNEESPAQDLERTIRQRDLLAARVLELEGALSEAEGESEAVARLKAALSARDDRILALQRQRDTAEDLLSKLPGLEDELTLAQRSARKASRNRDESEREREGLRRRCAKLELEIADLQMRLDEFQTASEHAGQSSTRLRAEREAHATTRNRLRSLERKKQREEDVGATRNDELEAARRALVLARARAEGLNAEVERLKNELSAPREAPPPSTPQPKP